MTHPSRSVSPATLYIYHKNKEDLLVSIFTEIAEMTRKKLDTAFEMVWDAIKLG